MKQQWILLLMFSLMVAACGTDAVEQQPEPTQAPPTEQAPTQQPTDLPTEAPSATAESTSTPIKTSFEGVTYRDDTAGFALGYPIDWGIGFKETQSRGEIVQLQDASGPRLDIVVLRWDPKQDLPAFLDVRRIAWDNSAIKVQEEQPMTLANGQEAVRFVVEGQDGDLGFFFFTTLGDRYLQLSGGGDLDLLKEIAQTVRVFPIAETSIQGKPLDCAMVTDQSDLWVPCNVRDGILSRNLSALHGFMADPFTLGYWGSESRSDSPAGITQELQTSRLPSDPSLPMTFTADRDAFPSLAGTPVDMLFGPDVAVDLVLYSEGWGLEGQGAALLYFAENAAGDLVWFAMAYSEAHFDQ